MLAAKTNNIEAIKLLLEKGARPNDLDEKGFTALIYAVISENTTATELLVSKTESGILTTMEKLAEHKISSSLIQNAMQNFINNDASLFFNFLNFAATFACRVWMEWLLKEFPTFTERLTIEERNTLFRNIIQSDDGEVFQLLLSTLKMASLSKELKDLILTREKKKVAEAFNLLIPPTASAKQATNDMLKSVEFSYHDDLEKLRKKLLSHSKSNILSVSFEELLREMKCPKVHYEDDSENSSTSCSDDCSQKRKCLRVRQIAGLIKEIMKQIARKYPIFEDPALIVVGSMKEDTKVGDVNECDMTLIMPKKFENIFKFDDEKQAIALTTMETPAALKEFVENGIFNSTKYYQTFVEEFCNVISNGELRLPEGLDLSPKFTPCDVCQSKEDFLPQYLRCRHNMNCPEHMKKKSSPKYVEQCDCKVFTAPSLTFSKIGVVLHLQFSEPDGSFLNFDVDVSPPVPSLEDVWNYDGSNEKKKAWLLKHRPVNWLPEYRKSYDMSAAAKDRWGHYSGQMEN